jgi:hypothetical protein
MKSLRSTLALSLLSLALTIDARAEVKVTAERNDNGTPAFKFPTVPLPRKADAGGKAVFSLLDGERDPNGGDLDKLSDGALPKNADDPRANFFFRAGSNGGAILLDLGAVTELKQVNTYSWHPGTRGPQVYQLFAHDGTGDGFKAKPEKDADLEKAGWKSLAKVDTRTLGQPGGQYGVSIADSAGSLGKFRYLIFKIERTESDDLFGNTFFSEIDAIDRNAPDAPEVAAAPAEPELKQITESVEIEGGFRFTVETTEAPDLTEWTHKELIPVIQKWYPLIVKMLPSEGYNAPRNFSITFTNSYKGVAATGGNRIECSPSWFRQNLKREGVGAVVHECVHVVQQYGRARRAGGARPPGWLTEGIPDYIRWYLFEPESHGADIRPGRAATAKYDGSYRISANFLNFVVNKYDKELIKELNAALREGKYAPEIWKTRTGKTVEELADEWKKGLEAPAAPGAPSAPAPATTPTAPPAKAPTSPAPAATPSAPSPAAPSTPAPAK